MGIMGDEFQPPEPTHIRTYEEYYEEARKEYYASLEKGKLAEQNAKSDR